MNIRFQSIFKSSFARLYGKPAWQVSPGYGSFLTMEFGEPHLRIREPKGRLTNRLVKVRGEWHLWIYCCNWQVFHNGTPVGDASLESSSKKKIIAAANYLDGQKLMRASMSEEGCRLTLDFDLGGQLVTEPYDEDSEQWFLYEPEAACLTVRADRQFQYGPSNSASEKWQQF
jgi:hypothetical protein